MWGQKGFKKRSKEPSHGWNHCFTFSYQVTPPQKLLCSQPYSQLTQLTHGKSLHSGESVCFVCCCACACELSVWASGFVFVMFPVTDGSVSGHMSVPQGNNSSTCNTERPQLASTSTQPFLPLSYPSLHCALSVHSWYRNYPLNPPVGTIISKLQWQRCWNNASLYLLWHRVETWCSAG